MLQIVLQRLRRADLSFGYSIMDLSTISTELTRNGGAAARPPAPGGADGVKPPGNPTPRACQGAARVVGSHVFLLSPNATPVFPCSRQPAVSGISSPDIHPHALEADAAGVLRSGPFIGRAVVASSSRWVGIKH